MGRIGAFGIRWSQVRLQFSRAFGACSSELSHVLSQSEVTLQHGLAGSLSRRDEERRGGINMRTVLLPCFSKLTFRRSLKPSLPLPPPPFPLRIQLVGHPALPAHSEAAASLKLACEMNDLFTYRTVRWGARMGITMVQGPETEFADCRRWGNESYLALGALRLHRQPGTRALLGNWTRSTYDPWSIRYQPTRGVRRHDRRFQFMYVPDVLDANH